MKLRKPVVVVQKNAFEIILGLLTDNCAVKGFWTLCDLVELEIIPQRFLCCLKMNMAAD